MAGLLSGPAPVPVPNPHAQQPAVGTGRSNRHDGGVVDLLDMAASPPGGVPARPSPTSVGQADLLLDAALRPKSAPNESAAAARAGEAAPELPGGAKIKRTSTDADAKNANAGSGRPSTAAAAPEGGRVVVPQRTINGGMDVKFDPDPRRTDLCDVLSPEEYARSVAVLNERLRTSRCTNVDRVLVATSPLVLPLAVLGRRRTSRSRRRKILLDEGIMVFNDSHPALRMRWNRNPAGDFLSIEPRLGGDGSGPMRTGLE